MSDNPTPKPRLRRWQFWLGGLLVTGFLFLVLLPLGVKYSLAWWLSDRTGAEISINDIDLNLFTGRASLSLLKGTGQEQSLDVGDSRLDFNWWPLTKKHLLLPELHVKDLVLDVRREKDGTLHIGGLSFPPPDEETTPAATADDSTEESNPWGVGCKKLHLENVELRYADHDLQVRLLVTQLELADLYSWTPEQAATLTGQFELNGGQFQVDLKATPFAEIPGVKGTLQIDTFPTGWLLPLVQKEGITRLDASISSELRLELNIPPEKGAQLDLEGELMIDDLDLALAQPPVTVQQESFSWQGELALAGAGQVQVAGELQGSQLRVRDNKLEMSALQLGRYSLSQLTLEQTSNIRVAKVNLEKAGLLQREAGEPDQHLVELQQLQLTALELTDLQQLGIEMLTLSGLDTAVVLKKKGGLSGDIWWQQPEQPTVEKASPPDPAEPSKPFHFRIGGLEIGDNSHLGFIDRGHEKPVELGLDNFLLKLGTLDSRAPATASELELSGDLDRYARLKVSGQIQPLLPAPGLELEGELKGLSLPQLNPYIIEVLQGRILNGQANADFTTRLQDNKLQAEIDLVFAQLETASSRAFESGSKKPPGSLTNMPLNLIKNSNGDVELDLEIEGDLSSPEFNTTELIQQAMLNAMGKAMTASLAPLGIQLITGVALPPGSTLLASALFDLMTKVNIPAVVFVPGESSLPESTADQLDKLEDLLEKRPKLQLRLCGMATRSDLAAIQKREMEKWKDPKQRQKTDTGKEPPARLTETEAAYVAYQGDLLELARQRADGIKGELVEQRGADPGRLYLCDPDIDVTEEGQPRADIRL